MKHTDAELVDAGYRLSDALGTLRLFKKEHPCGVCPDCLMWQNGECVIDALEVAYSRCRDEWEGLI